MSDQRNLSDPISIRLPKDVLFDIEAIAAICERSRSWVLVRALKLYLATEGKELMDLAQARQDVDDGQAIDLDAVLEEIEAIATNHAA